MGTCCRMENLLLLCIICLVDLCQGSSNVFVLKGEDVRLEVQKPVLEENFDLTWTFKSEDNAVKFSSRDGNLQLHDNYRGRVEFSKEDFSLRLKNLQEADSGVYTAVVFGQQTKNVAEHSVTVLERVSPVVLEVHNSSSSDSCNLTVNCSSRDSSISSTVRCDTGTCSQEEGERSEVTTLYVYLSNDLIICNHSNQVSRSNDTKMIPSHCRASSKPDITPPNLWWISLIVLCLCAFACGVCYLLYRRQQCGNYDRETEENTVYATPEIPSRRQPVEQSPSADTLLSSPSSTYSVVGHHSAPKGPNEVEGSVYAQVQKPAPQKN